MLKCSETLVDNKPDFSARSVFSFEKESHIRSRGGYLQDGEHKNVYLPNPSYAFTVQNSERFVVYREQTYRWMVDVFS